MEIVRAAPYLRGLKRLKKLGASDRDIAAMEAAVVGDPEAGDVIQDAGGLRKLRFGYGNLGKRGGGRVVFIVLRSNDVLAFIMAYAKADKADLTAEEKRVFKALVEEIKDE